jgi:hypothetical protein
MPSPTLFAKYAKRMWARLLLYPCFCVYWLVNRRIGLEKNSPLDLLESITYAKISAKSLTLKDLFAKYSGIRI